MVIKLQKAIKNYLISKVLLLITLFLIVVIVLLVIFIMSESLPIVRDYGIFNFIFGLNWSPDNNEFGVFPMIIGTLLITIISLFISAPLALSCGIFLEEIAPVKLKLLFKPVIQTLVGIPSVIYGFFGLMVLSPLIRNTFGGSGFSIITASIILALMVLPTIISITQDSIKGVPNEYKEASLALGSTKWQCIKKIILPTALPGIITALILGFTRAIGETLAVLMLIGNVSQIPDSLLSPARTLTSNIALEMGYATNIHYNALFMTSSVLFVIIIIFMLFLTFIQSKYTIGDNVNVK